MRHILIHILGILISIPCISCGDREQDVMAQKSGVYLTKSEAGYTLMRNGSPFFIKGASGSADYIEELKQIGGNTIRFYDTLNFTEKLDRAHKSGLAVIAEITLPRYRESYNPYATEAGRKEITTKVRAFVAQHKDHPALLAWMLGNEINFPRRGNAQGFTAYFNELVHLVKATDPSHPVTSAIAQSGRDLVLNISYRTDLDFLSINTFGGIKELGADLNQISLLWDGPYLISEWSDEGPWKSETTKWGTPLEPPDSKKAERMKALYTDYITPFTDRCLGSLAFYWGQKQERTHTWFSLFSESGEKTPAVAVLESLFKDDPDIAFDGPQMHYVMLNRYGPQENILVFQDQINTADVFYNAEDCNTVEISWEILPEVWSIPVYEREKEIKPSPLNHLILETTDNLIRFKSPEKEGPYRIFTYVRDLKGNMTSANFPFYVMNRAHAQNE